MLKLNNMASSALFRRISSSQILRSYRIAANRLITSCVTSPESPPTPWQMLNPERAKADELIFRFQCCAESNIYNFYSQFSSCNMNCVGSSHGWVIFQENQIPNWTDGGVHLSDPITRRHVKLPPLDKTMEKSARVTLAGREGKAFVISGADQRLAFCDPQRSCDWTVFGGDEAYESAVYSISHRRLLCITSSFNFEAWDVDDRESESESPRLDWATRFDSPYPDGLTRVAYLVCADERVFVMVRLGDLDRDHWSDVGADGDYLGPTVGFDVYEIDGGLMMRKMEESLEGLTMFVGMNQPFAVRDVAGLKADAIYFAADNRINSGYHDHGIFYYRKGAECRRWTFSHPNYDSYHSLWFIPNAN